MKVYIEVEDSAIQKAVSDQVNKIVAEYTAEKITAKVDEILAIKIRSYH